MKYLRTSDLARAVGVHPNTVRRYVDRGLLPPVEYSPSGYRRFTPRHLDCLRLARQVYCNQYPGKAILQSGIRIIQATVSGDLGDALGLAYRHLALVQSERAQADVAAGRISMVSPLGAALMGRTVGDEVTFASPGGSRAATITSVRALSTTSRPPWRSRPSDSFLWPGEPGIAKKAAPTSAARMQPMRIRWRRRSFKRNQEEA